MANPQIKQINIGGVTYDINAPYFDGHSWDEVTALAEAGFEIEIVTSLPTISADNYQTYRNKLLFIADESAEAGTYLEYVAYKTSGETPTYGLEKIGSTKTDLSNYVQKGTYTTAAASGNTGNGGAQTATGTASVTYKKSATTTGSAGGSVDFSKATFEGTEGTISLSEAATHTHAISGS